jgi:hypothetical protein
MRKLADRLAVFRQCGLLAGVPLGTLEGGAERDVPYAPKFLADIGGGTHRLPKVQVLQRGSAGFALRLLTGLSLRVGLPTARDGLWAAFPRDRY